MKTLRPLILLSASLFFSGCNLFTARAGFGTGNELVNNPPGGATASPLEPAGPTASLAQPSGCLRSLYVASAGNDGNSGSATAPWATLQHASDQSQPGDCIFVLPGVYSGFVMGWDTPQGGTAGAPIVFRAQPSVVINSPNAHTQDGIDLEGASYVTIENFEILGQSRAGIRAVSNGTDNSTGVIISHNYSHDNGDWAIFTSHVDNLLIEYNQASNSMIQHGIYVSNACVKPVVRGNQIWGNAGCGLHMNGDISQGGNGVIVGALVERNIIHDNGATSGGSAINGDGIQSSTIQDNILYNNHATGIALFQTDAAEPSMNNVVSSNTILEASDARFDIEVADGTDSNGNPLGSTGNVVVNNILYDYNASHGSITVGQLSLADFTSDHNLVSGNFSDDGDNTTISFAQWRSATGQDAHSLVISDVGLLFVSLGTNDFHLAPGSQAIDAGGTAYAPYYDFDGSARPQHNAFDIGAYEWSGN